MALPLSPRNLQGETDLEWMCFISHKTLRLSFANPLRVRQQIQLLWELTHHSIKLVNRAGIYHAVVKDEDCDIMHSRVDKNPALPRSAISALFTSPVIKVIKVDRQGRCFLAFRV